MADMSKLIAQIRIDTEYGPPIVLDDPFGANAAASGPSPLKWLKPRVTIVPAVQGINPIVSQPWGPPGPTKWPQVQAGLVIAGALGLGFLAYGIYKTLK